MSNKINPELLMELSNLLSPFPDALEFANLYRDYVHLIDDLVDSESRPTSEEILKVMALASAVFTCDFWMKYGKSLFLLEQSINNTYADSVKWEDDAVAWKREAAGTLRHAGIEMFFAVLLITVGRDKTREFSLRFREQCHELHMDERGNPV